MESINDYVRKEGIEQLIEKLNEVSSGGIEQHKFPQNSKVSVDDWFEFLSNMNEIYDSNTKNLSFVDFNYLEVEDIAMKYVNDNSPVSRSELIRKVANRVSTATEEDVESWLFTMTADGMEFNEEGDIISVRRSFEPSVY
jgi:hypothetical protein